MISGSTPPPSCDDDYDSQSLPVAEALRRIAAVIRPIAGTTRLAIREALDRVLAEAVFSPLDVPGHTNSAVDGYAVHAQDLGAEDSQGLRVVGRSMAGQPFAGSVEPGTAVRIMTGAVVPPGAAAVVMQEHTVQDGDRVRVHPGTKSGQNVRQAGEDFHRGDQILHAGKRLDPADIGLLASIGVVEVTVQRRLRVAFFSTGDELRSLGEPLEIGQIYDSNRYTLHGMLTRIGVDMIDMGVVRDEPDALQAALAEAALISDAVITSGGVSVGEADYIKEMLGRIGEVNFWKIAMKPGRPLAFGRIGNAVFFGLPGNPVSVMVTFYQFVRPALLHMLGQQPEPPISFQVPCSGRLKKRPGRKEFQRGILERTADGDWIVHGTGDQGSGILSTMSRANCFIILEDDVASVEAGQPVTVQPFAGLV